ncbi:MAG: histidinol-phosphate transaminase [Victivallales bacterium]|nr:histidinol-phosphate transaminase [Victivallales bacterium]
MNTREYKSYFRADIDAIAGYTPGEQPKVNKLIKLNTNENPYPPSPRISDMLKNFDASLLRLYPQPMCDSLRDVIAGLHGVERNNIIVGNGSDDILTIAVRCFSDAGKKTACVDPTYSLYEVLTGIQGGQCVKIPLNEDFSLPENLLELLDGVNLLLLPRPNAPTGNSFDKSRIDDLCANFDGIVLIDGAYADFAKDSCMELAMKYPNVIVSRTLSKSYSLAGVRLGYAVAHRNIIEGMMKVKDSYNVNMLTQKIAIEALLDRDYLEKTVAKIKLTRARLSRELAATGFKVMPSEANFVLASPPDGNAGLYFEALRKHNIIVRYFPGDRTGAFVRITVGTDDEIDQLLEVTRGLYAR